VCIFSILCQWRAEKAPSSHPFFAPLIFDCACAQEGAHIFKRNHHFLIAVSCVGHPLLEKKTSFWLLCLIPNPVQTARWGALIFNCTRKKAAKRWQRMCLLGQLGPLHLFLVSEIFSLVPNYYLLAPAAGCQKSGARTRQLFCAESFWGGGLVGGHVGRTRCSAEDSL
jgi:hypothetical protein